MLAQLIIAFLLLSILVHIWKAINTNRAKNAKLAKIQKKIALLEAQKKADEKKAQEASNRRLGRASGSSTQPPTKPKKID